MAPTEWTGRRAVVAFPDHVDKRLAARMSEQLVEVLSRGARLVVADMSGTVRCDPACADMLIRIYQKALFNPVARPMADRIRLAGVGKDGATRPVTITLSPVPTASGHLILAVVRDATQAARRDDLAGLAWAVAAERELQAGMLHDRIVSALFHVGLSLQAAAGQPAEAARGRIADALIRLDQVIHDIRDHVFRVPRGGDGS